MINRYGVTFGAEETEVCIIFNIFIFSDFSFDKILYVPFPRSQKVVHRFTFTKGMAYQSNCLINFSFQHLFTFIEVVFYIIFNNLSIYLWQNCFQLEPATKIIKILFLQDLM